MELELGVHRFFINSPTHFLPQKGRRTLHEGLFVYTCKIDEIFSFNVFVQRYRCILSKYSEGWTRYIYVLFIEWSIIKTNFALHWKLRVGLLKCRFSWHNVTYLLDKKRSKSKNLSSCKNAVLDIFGAIWPYLIA